MDAIKLTKDDHRKVEDLFGKFQEAGPRAYKTKQRLAERITTMAPTASPSPFHSKSPRLMSGPYRTLPTSLTRIGVPFGPLARSAVIM